MLNIKSYQLFLEHNNNIQIKIDAILDKISEEGIDSLSKEELEFLDSDKSEKAYKRLTAFDSDKPLVEPGENTNKVNPSMKDWYEFTKSNEISDDVIEFIRNNPEYLMKFSPRVWKVVSDSINHAKNKKGLHKVIELLTDKTIADEFMNEFYN